MTSGFGAEKAAAAVPGALDQQIRLLNVTPGRDSNAAPLCESAGLQGSQAMLSVNITEERKPNSSRRARGRLLLLGRAKRVSHECASDSPCKDSFKASPQATLASLESSVLQDNHALLNSLGSNSHSSEKTILSLESIELGKSAQAFKEADTTNLAGLSSETGLKTITTGNVMGDKNVGANDGTRNEIGNKFQGTTSNGVRNDLGNVFQGTNNTLSVLMKGNSSTSNNVGNVLNTENFANIGTANNVTNIGQGIIDNVNVNRPQMVNETDSSLVKKYQTENNNNAIAVPISTFSNTKTRQDSHSHKRKDIITINNIPYKKFAMLGKGGSSKVYKVINPANSKIYAIKKVMFTNEDHNIVAGYKSEIDLLNKLKGHQRIITLLDSEILDHKNQIYMLMECGEIDFAHLLQRQAEKTVSLNFIRLYWEQMLEAVNAVHQLNIVHSDLKPANFLLVEGSLKLIDFGIAKAIGNDTTNIHRDTQIGTINYMSPEALLETDSGVRDGRVKCGRASDIWSLGCILYQMVYGKTPFSHLSMVQKINVITFQNTLIEFPKTSKCLEADINGDLLQVLKSCLARDAKKRPLAAQLLKHLFLYPEQNKIQQEDVCLISQTQIRLLFEHLMEFRLTKDITPSMLDSLSKEAFDTIKMSR